MDVPSAPGLLAWLETSALGVAMREWAWLYPIVENQAPFRSVDE